MTALFESLSLMFASNVFSWSIPTYLHFSRVGKPILDRTPILLINDQCGIHHVGEELCPVGQFVGFWDSDCEWPGARGRAGHSRACLGCCSPFGQELRRYIKGLC